LQNIKLYKLKRVVVGLSGGVDSSVSAYLLKELGYEVIGMFMRNWHDETVTLSDECPWIDDSNDALLIAEQLNIPFQVIDLSNQYRERIVEYMFSEYQAGRTPNPDVLCNREIKFDVFLKAAIDLGAEYVATGHYCQRHEHEDGTVSLISGADNNKDQSYFLCQLEQHQLQRILFPIGHLQKSEVRAIAQRERLVTANKRDSQGLCFVGKISLPEFLQQKLVIQEGPIIEIPNDHPVLKAYQQIEVSPSAVDELAAPFQFSLADGIRVGQHQGAHFYTVGQRKGLQIGGRPHPSFAIQIDTENNIVFTGQTDQHLGLNKWALKIDKESIKFTRLNNDFRNGLPRSFDIRIRYRQPLQQGQVIEKNGDYFVLFRELQRGITPGQFCAWYNGDELIGSGVIAH
jgi:tRNA-uridine 2-sulfurtransferase